MGAGFSGREIGEMLDWLLDQVMEGHLLNHRDVLIEALKEKKSDKESE